MKTLVAGVVGVAVAVTLLAAPVPKDSVALAGLAWVRDLGEETYDAAGQAVAWDEAGSSLYVAGVSTEPGKADQGGSFWLRKLDPSGEVRATFPIPHERGQAPVNRAYRYFGGVVVLPGGDVLLVVELGQRRPVLMRLNASGRVVFSKVLAEHSTAIARLVPAEPGRFLLVGRQERDALAMKVDENGQPIWTRRFDRDGGAGFLDVVPTENGGFLAAGVTRDDDPAKGERVWVVRGNAEGLRQADVSFAGREPALAKAPDGTFRIVYDEQADTFAHDAWLLGLDAKLTTLSKTPLLPKEPGFPVRLGIVAHPRGGFLVGGGKGLGLWLQRVDAQGRPGWSWADGPERPLRAPGHEAGWCLEFQAFAATRDALYVAATVQRTDVPAGVEFRAGLLKLTEP